MNLEISNLFGQARDKLLADLEKSKQATVRDSIDVQYYLWLCDLIDQLKKFKPSPPAVTDPPAPAKKRNGKNFVGLRPTLLTVLENRRDCNAADEYDYFDTIFTDVVEQMNISGKKTLSIFHKKVYACLWHQVRKGTVLIDQDGEGVRLYRLVNQIQTNEEK